MHDPFKTEYTLEPKALSGPEGVHCIWINTVNIQSQARPKVK